MALVHALPSSAELAQWRKSHHPERNVYFDANARLIEEYEVGALKNWCCRFQQRLACKHL